MNQITYIRNGQMPVCNNCKKDMGWWNPFMKEEDYECVPCTADRISDAMIEAIKAQFLASQQSSQTKI